MQLKNEWVNNEIKMEINSSLITNENENTGTQNVQDSVKAVLQGKLSTTGLPWEHEKLK